MEAKIFCKEVYSITGIGSVIVGEVKSGTLVLGQMVNVNGSGYSVKSIEMNKSQVNQANVGEAPRELPINYYDNDDGFWDDYILEKQGRWEQAGMIVNRRDFIH